jgi:hypothetical protein
MVAAGAATGGQTGMAAVRRKQLKSQQLQPVATAANIATADKTNSFLMNGLLGKTDRGEHGRNESLGQPDCAARWRSESAQSADRATRCIKGGGLSNSTPWLP